jgi:hypothetical protein
MSDELPDVGKQVGTGDASANSQTSQPQAQPLTADVTTLVAEIKALKGEVNALKSGKDKAVNRLEEEWKPLKELAKYLNVDEDTVREAQRNMLLDKLVAQSLSSPQPEQVATGTSTPQVARADVQTLASQYGLDPIADAPFLLSLVSEPDPSKVELMIARKARDKTSQPNPTPASSPAPMGGTPVTQKGEELVGEYKTKMLTNKGNKELLRQIKEEYRQKGCPVDHVNFSI